MEATYEFLELKDLLTPMRNVYFPEGKKSPIPELWNILKVTDVLWLSRSLLLNQYFQYINYKIRCKEEYVLISYAKQLLDCVISKVL